MGILRRYRVLAAKIETTPGTAESLADADSGFSARDIVIDNDTEMEERMGELGFAPIQSQRGPKRGRVSFTIDVTWDGTATEPKWADTFLPACGWVKSGQVYTPRTEAPGTNVKTVTIGVYTKTSGTSKRRLLKGAVGRFTWENPTGKTSFINFEFEGVWDSESAATMLAPTPTADAKLSHRNSTTTWGGVPLCLSALTLTSENEIYLKECPNSDGFSHGIITGRRITVAADPEAVLIATQDRMQQFENMTEGILTWDLDGPTNSEITIAAPKAQIIAIPEGDRSGLLTDQLEFVCNADGANLDQEASITFTAAT